MQLYLFQEKTGRWVFLSVPSTLSPGWAGAGSQLQAVSFFATVLLDPEMQATEPGDQGVALWQQPQHLGSHTCAQTLFTETPVTCGGTEGEHDDGTCWLLRFWRGLQLTPRYVLEVLAFKIRK